MRACVFTGLVTSSLSPTMVPFSGMCFLSCDGGVFIHVPYISAQQNLSWIHLWQISSSHEKTVSINNFIASS